MEGAEDISLALIMTLFPIKNGGLSQSPREGLYIHNVTITVPTVAVKTGVYRGLGLGCQGATPLHFCSFWPLHADWPAILAVHDLHGGENAKRNGT